jgi:predicted dehydrogenase
MHCLAQGVSVLLEKPIAHTVEAAEMLVSAARRSTAILGVCLQNRYNENALRLHELLKAGALGRVLGARAAVTWHRDAEYYARREWRGRWATAGGGVLMNQAIHTLDLLRWLLGPIDEVRGVVGTLALSQIEVEDTAALQLRHRTAAGDVVGSVLHATNGHVENSPVELEVITERACARLGLDLSITYRDGRTELFEATNAATGPRAYWGDSHRLLIEDFYRHVRAGQQFWIDGPTALESLRAIQAVYEQCLGLRA